MEDTRRAIRKGRTLAARGLYERAKMTWKAALSTAYSTQDYAGMFVLSVNIGEACIWIATQSNTTSQTLSQLQEANKNLEYALQLVENCCLWNKLAGNRALYQGVQRAETLRRKAKKLLDKLQPIEKEQETTGEKEGVRVCTTCGVGGGDIVLDENDGCYYCRKCYEEYYATVGKYTSIDTVEEVIAVQAMDGLRKEERNGLNAELCLDEKQGDASADLVDVESSATAELVEVMRVDSEEKQAEESDEENYGKVEPDRIRSERVELGSLVDFLAGTMKVGDKVERPEMQHNDIRNYSHVLVATASAEEKECVKEPIAGDDQEMLHEASSATSGKSVPCEEGIGLLDEDTSDRAREKCKYTIARLLELRKLSPCDCPEPILASPVRDDGSTPTPARNKVNNSRKKLNTKKSTRSAASYQHNNTDVAGPSQAKVPEEIDATLSVSPLPTMYLCNTMRMALQKERQTDSDTLRWPLAE